MGGGEKKEMVLGRETVCAKARGESKNESGSGGERGWRHEQGPGHESL